MNFKAENKTRLLDILRVIDINGPLLNGSRRNEDTEQYAMAHLLSSLAEESNILKFPLEVLHRKQQGGKPDFLLTMNGKNIGIEHTDARSKYETKKDVLRRKEGIGRSVYLATPVEPNEPSQNAKQLRKEISSNEPGAGWSDQDGIDRNWVDVMIYFIDKKEKKLNASDFSRFDRDWLLIRDAWPFPSVNLTNAIKHLSSQIVSRNIELKFHCVFIISSSDRGPVCEIAEHGFTLHRRNDLWL